jgi:hypothetical protein
VQHLAAVDETINEGDDAGSVRKDVGPFGEGFVRGEHDGLEGFVAARDDLEEQIGVTAVVGKVADLVDAEQLRVDVVLPNDSRWWSASLRSCALRSSRRARLPTRSSATSRSRFTRRAGSPDRRALMCRSTWRSRAAWPSSRVAHPAMAMTSRRRMGIDASATASIPASKDRGVGERAQVAGEVVIEGPPGRGIAEQAALSLELVRSHPRRRELGIGRDRLGVWVDATNEVVANDRVSVGHHPTVRTDQVLRLNDEAGLLAHDSDHRLDDVFPQAQPPDGLIEDLLSAALSLPERVGGSVTRAVADSIHDEQAAGSFAQRGTSDDDLGLWGHGDWVMPRFGGARLLAARAG